MIRIKRGLNLPIAGEPSETAEEGPRAKTVALVGEDYIGMRPTLKVKVGDSVKIGDQLFTDKKCPQIIYTAPACGTVIEINRGEKRVFQSLVIKVNGSESLSFGTMNESTLTIENRSKVVNQLLESGQWTSLRARPFGKIADPNTTPQALFINTMDTNPLAPSFNVVISGREKEFVHGLKVLNALGIKKNYLCKSPSVTVPGEDLPFLRVETFTGAHPAGNTGTHVHYLHPLNQEDLIWHINYQDVIAIGHLFNTGKIDTNRMISVAGPMVTDPKHMRVQLGSCLEDITQGRVKNNGLRLISGSVFGGRCSYGPIKYLGRFHSQVTVLEEGTRREFLGWQSISSNKFSIKNLYLSKFTPNKKFNFTTSTNGSPRSIVPVGSFEQVNALDLEPTYLLRALCSGDTDYAQKVGCLDLLEEDMSLWTFVCPSKIEYGPILRNALNTIEKEG